MLELVYARGTSVALLQRCSRIKEQSNRKLSDLTIIYNLSFGRRRVLSSPKKKRKKVMYDVFLSTPTAQFCLRKLCDLNAAISLCTYLFEGAETIQLFVYKDGSGIPCVTFEK